MTDFDLILDGSNIMLRGRNKGGMDKSVVELSWFQEKLEFFCKLGYRALLCFDWTTFSKIEKGMTKIDGSLEDLRRILDKHSAILIYSDHEMAEFALRHECPIVTNDLFDDWRNGKVKNKKNTISTYEWDTIHRQSLRHKIDKEGRFTVIPPLKQKLLKFDVKSRTDQLARDNLRLKDEVAALRRQKELQRATIVSLRKSMNFG